MRIHPYTHACATTHTCTNIHTPTNTHTHTPTHLGVVSVLVWRGCGCGCVCGCDVCSVSWSRLPSLPSLCVCVRCIVDSSVIVTVADSPRPPPNLTHTLAHTHTHTHTNTRTHARRSTTRNSTSDITHLRQTRPRHVTWLRKSSRILST